MAYLVRSIFTFVLFALAANLTVPRQSEPPAEVWPGFIRAERYIHLSPTQESIYAAGLVDGMYLAPVFDAPNKDKYLTAMRTCIKPMTNTQVAAIITKFTREHPEKWDMGANVVGWQALREACDAR